MTIHQSMSAAAVQKKIDAEAQIYGRLIQSEQWTLEDAHSELRRAELDLFKTAGLAKAIACFQCSEN